MKIEWDAMKFDQQMRWIEQAEFLKKKGFFPHINTDELAKRIYEAKIKC